MFLVLSKTLDWLLSPLSWALLLLALGLGLGLRRKGRWGPGLALAGLLVLGLFSTELVANLLDRWVERGAADTRRPGAVYDAVIVLGGGLDPAATEASGEPQYNQAGERVLRGFELLRGGQARNVILSGGTLDTHPGAVVEADVLERQLQGWGIDPARIVRERTSRNTRENAIETAKIVRARGWTSLLLVTSAAHLPRALGCFRAVGLAPDALPVDRRSPPGLGGLVPRAGHLAASADALRELAGRLVYRLAGYTRP